ncbi:MAG: endo alpha-1,4 polygalactosaminidase [Candidatus Glassbacteria bacterium]|nr:endo alpha-1,4 polygalactosaminidase [Candidatus Glassbacteria bacterium]
MTILRLVVACFLIPLSLPLVSHPGSPGARLQAGESAAADGYREDINGDGRVLVSDVISLLLLGRDDPADPRADYNGDGRYSVNDAIALLINIMAGDLTPADPGRDFRQEMRDLVMEISTWARAVKPGFIVIPQNGHELLTENGEESGTPALAYIRAIDGVGREDLFYGYDEDDEATPGPDRDYMTAFMDLAVNNGLRVLVTDYCLTRSLVDDSYAQSAARGYISFSADHRELDDIPQYPPAPYNLSDSDVSSLEEAKNFLYLLNPGAYITRQSFIESISGTDFDVVITDLFYEGTDELTPGEVASLKVKANGGSRLVIAYMSIGEAEDYRYYWQEGWEAAPPSWLAEENPDWPGNFKVRYWDEDWKEIIFGNPGSYLQKIIDTGFDGVYLDIIDAFEFFEEREEQTAE